MWKDEWNDMTSVRTSMLVVVDDAEGCASFAATEKSGRRGSIINP